MTPLARQAGAPYIPQTPSMHPSDQVQLYCRAPNLYPKITVPLSPAKITEWLKKAADYAPQLSLYWDYIDKPTDGQIIMVWSPPSLENLPPDGYHWIDAEKSYRLPSSEGRELICYELKQGFLHGERVTSMSRRRYRLKGHGANECLMLIHYRRSEDADRVLVDESQVRYPPRRYPLAPIPAPVGSNLTSRSQAGIMNVPSSEGSSIRSLPNPATSVPRLQQRAPHTPSKKKTVTGLMPKSATSLPLENDGGTEPYGDDLDHLTARDVALARYKRNHEHITELFAPVQSSSLKRPRLDLLDRKQKLLEIMEKDKSEAENLRLNHAERMSVFKSSSSEFWKQYGELERCGSLEELEQAQGGMELQLNLTIREYQKVRMVNV